MIDIIIIPYYHKNELEYKIIYKSSFVVRGSKRYEKK